MFVERYTIEELNFAYCYRVYLRWHSYCRRPLGIKSFDNRSELEANLDPMGVHVLEANIQNETDLGLLISLRPDDSVSAAVSKVKGQCSKCMREKLEMPAAEQLFGRGYFAATCGKSNEEDVMEYLNIQGDHHDYINVGPAPVYTEEVDDIPRIQGLQTSHAETKLLFHVVLCTPGRLGFFSSAHGRATTELLKRWQEEQRYRLLKVSFVPDHVHLALRLHPTVVPSQLILTLMNEIQDFAGQNFSSQMVRKGLKRLWQPSAYIGSFGDITSAAMKQYVADWASE